MFSVGDRVIHFTGLLYGTVIGFRDLDGIVHIAVRHEDKYYKDDGAEGITLWIPDVLSLLEEKGK